MPQGRSPQPAADSLTTRERRHRPVLAVFTGEGKGKTTAACGMALRGWAQGWSIAVYQFVKSPTWRCGEQAAFAALDRAHAGTGAGGPVEWHRMGAGWSWLPARDDTDPAQAAREGWNRVREQLAAQVHTVYLLDEFTYPMTWGWIDADEVAQTLAARPGCQHVVITGRDCPKSVLQAADLVTTMTKTRHPFDQGRRGQAGIEW